MTVKNNKDEEGRWSILVDLIKVNLGQASPTQGSGG